MSAFGAERWGRKGLLLALSSLVSACVEGGAKVEIPAELSRAWLVSVAEPLVSIEDVDLSMGPPVLVAPEGARSFLVGVNEAELRAQEPGLTTTAQLELELEPAHDRSCEHGVLERRTDGSLFRTRLASGISHSTGLGAEGPWPPVLEDLVLRVPLEEQCKTMPARFEPFGADDMLFEFGDVFPTAPLTPETVAQSHVRSVDYIDEDHLLLGFIDAIAILSRGQKMRDALVFEHGRLPFPPRNAPDEYWQVIALSLEPGSAPRRRAHGVLVLLRADRTLLGSAIVAFTVTATSVSTMVTRTFIDPESGLMSQDNLRQVATGADGSFVAVGRNLVVAGGEGGPVTVSNTSRINGTSVIYFPETSASVLIQSRAGQWWRGDPTRPEQLVLETSGASIVDSGGMIRLMPTENGGVPVSGTESGELWRRRPDGIWFKHDWWLPEDARACSSPEAVCGRPVARPFFDVTNQGPVAGGVVHTFERCDAIFLTFPGEDACSQMLSVTWSEHRLMNDRDFIFPIAVYENRATIGGDGGLLRELTFD